MNIETLLMLSLKFQKSTEKKTPNTWSWIWKLLHRIFLKCIVVACFVYTVYNMRVQSRNFCKLNQGSDYQGLILYVCFTVGHFASNITPVSYCGYLSSSLIRKSFYRCSPPLWRNVKHDAVINPHDHPNWIFKVLGA